MARYIFFSFAYDKFKTYCWINDDGHKEFSSWVDDAAEQAGRKKND